MKLRKGFTLIELLVVIAIIGILATVVINSLSSARKRARDARRIADMKTIYTALVLYHEDNGSIRRPIAYDSERVNGFDVSFTGNFLSFLSDEGYLSEVPLDPLNTTSDTSSHLHNSDSDYFYRYICYPSGGGQGMRLVYRSEADGNIVYYSRDNAIGDANFYSDGYFNC
jgi:type II secretion system protein G